MSEHPTGGGEHADHGHESKDSKKENAIKILKRIFSLPQLFKFVFDIAKKYTIDPVQKVIQSGLGFLRRAAGGGHGGHATAHAGAH